MVTIVADAIQGVTTYFGAMSSIVHFIHRVTCWTPFNGCGCGNGDTGYGWCFC